MLSSSQYVRDLVSKSVNRVVRTNSGFPYSTQPTEPSKCPAAAVTECATKSAARQLTFSDDDYERARPFREIPGPSGLKFLANIAFPWGRYYGKDMVGIFKELQKEYGDVVRFPSVMGRAPMYFVCDPEEAEVIFRNEGPTPFRMTLEIFDIFRREERADLFGEMAGLVQE